MNGKLIKLAAAAIIVMGAFLGIAIFNETGSVSWAQVRQQVAAVKAVLYKAQVNGTQKGQPSWPTNTARAWTLTWVIS